ncbi:MAG: hypothetical protein ACXACG_00540 [Candidatus Thorarchaeota archaeon]
MFGKSIIKLIGLIFAGAIALAGGAELLASVVGVVLAFRAGNPFPLLLVGIVTIILLRVVKKQTEETPVKMILNIVAYAATGYLVVVAFVVALPYGLMASIVTAIATSVVISFIGDPSSILSQVQNYVPSTLGGSINGLPKRVVQTEDGSSFTVNFTNSVIVINPDHRDKVVDLMRDRSLLPTSLTHFEDLDVLFISNEGDRTMFERVNSLLNSYGIETKGPVPALLAEALQMLPIIDEQNGLSMKEYRLAKDEKTISDLLSLWPARMTIFPTEQGLRVLVPDIDVIGFNVEPLKQGHESEVLLHRDFTSIREVKESVESPA